MNSTPKLTPGEIDLIEFLFEYRLFVENEINEVEIVDYLKSISGDYFQMFEATSAYHDDDRLTKKESKIIERLYSKFQ